MRNSSLPATPQAQGREPVMAKIIAGIGTSHVPSIGVVHDQGRHDEPDWKPLFDAYKPVKKWLNEIKPDIAIVVYNDHGCDFFFDKYPTFAIGAAEIYEVGDEVGVAVPCPLCGQSRTFLGTSAIRWYTTNSTSRYAKKWPSNTALWCRCTFAGTTMKHGRCRSCPWR